MLLVSSLPPLLHEAQNRYFRATLLPLLRLHVLLTLDRTSTVKDEGLTVNCLLKGQRPRCINDYFVRGGQGQMFSLCSCSPTFSMLSQQNYFINSFFNKLIKRGGSKKHMNVELSNIICQMQVQTQFKLNTSHIRQRLLSIIDFHLQQISRTQQTNNHQLVMLNQSLLEEWYEMLIKMVYLKQSKKNPTKAVKIAGTKSDSNKILPQIRAVPALPYRSSSILISPDRNYFNCYQVESQQEGSRHSFKNSFTKLQFKPGLINRFCTYNLINQHQILFIGGCSPGKVVKSPDIMSFHLQTNQLFKIAELPYGVSSHGSVKVHDKIYIVGGNRDPNIVTKRCLQFDVRTKKYRQIGSLHFVSASHCLLNWKDRFVYKFGGMGSCFGEWDISPYIERYDIRQNAWEIVNPIVKINQNLLQYYTLLINSIAYLSRRDSIVVLGGFDLNQQASRKMFEISVREQQNEGQISTIHQLINFGELQNLEAGGFLSQQPIIVHSQIFAIQSIPNDKSNPQQKLLRISKEVHYV